MKFEMTQAHAEGVLKDRGFSRNSLDKWRLPHGLYRPNKLELQLLHWLLENAGLTMSDEAKLELARQQKRPLICRLGIHQYGLWVREYGPQTAIQMNLRSGALVAIYHGEWKTCAFCGAQRIREGFPEN